MLGSDPVPLRLLTQMSALTNIYAFVQRFVQAQGKQIHAVADSNPQLLDWLVGEGLL